MSPLGVSSFQSNPYFFTLPCFATASISFLIFFLLPATCFYKFIYLFIYFWLCWVLVAARGLSFSCGERGLLFIAVRGLLIAVASLVAEHGL